MGKKFLIDTNILIYFSINSFPDNIDKKWLLKLFEESFNISVITKIEFLGWQKHSEETYKKAEQMLKSANIYSLDSLVVEKTISVCRQKKIKLPDAVIASTCLISDFTLVTRNTNDFNGIEDLKILNPFII